MFECVNLEIASGLKLFRDVSRSGTDQNSSKMVDLSMNKS